MPRTKTLPEIGTLVTVTITDDSGVAHEFHGTLHEVQEVVAQTWQDSPGVQRFNYAPTHNLRGERLPDIGEGTPWVHIYSATGNQFPKTTLPERTLSHYVWYHEMWADTAAANVTVKKATKAAQKWIRENLSLDNKRRLLIEQVKALDPKLADAIDDLISDIADEAREQGREDEWRANNG